jgi:hypothetical protein
VIISISICLCSGYAICFCDLRIEFILFPPSEEGNRTYFRKLFSYKKVRMMHRVKINNKNGLTGIEVEPCFS